MASCGPWTGSGGILTAGERREDGESGGGGDDRVFTPTPALVTAQDAFDGRQVGVDRINQIVFVCQANVLQHLSGHLQDFLGPEDQKELADAIEDYRSGLVPSIVPITLIRHFVRLHHVAYLEGQSYLEPHPKELMLRNHV